MSHHPPTKVHISWEEFDRACDSLARALATKTSTRCIMPVARGGLVPAARLAYSLGLPIPNLLQPMLHATVRTAQVYAGNDIIIVDDVADTGATFYQLRRFYPNALFVAPFVKPKGRVHCNRWAVEYPQDTWLIFPWALSDVVNR